MVTQFLVLLGAGIGTSVLLDNWAGHEFPIMLVLTLFGSFISYIYSAPPLKLKQSGWIGNYALGSSYIALPWWAGQVRLAGWLWLVGWLAGWLGGGREQPGGSWAAADRGSHGCRAAGWSGLAG